ncbi:MAG: dihydrofolate reductase family protein, partial [Haloechinothrix sp.]
ALPDFIPPPVVVDAEARHRRDGIGRVGIYLATGGEFLVAAVRNARLAYDSVPEEVRSLKEQVDGDLAVGGAALAANCIELDLVDEYRLFVNPVIVAGGKPFFPSTHASLELELVETRSFASRVVYLRYQRSR